MFRSVLPILLSLCAIAPAAGNEAGQGGRQFEDQRAAIVAQGQVHEWRAGGETQIAGLAAANELELARRAGKQIEYTLFESRDKQSVASQLMSRHKIFEYSKTGIWQTASP